MSDATHVSAPEGIRAIKLGSGLLIEIEETPRGQVTLRGDLADKTLAGAVKALAGVAVPGPRSAAFDGERGAVWMSPDELLLMLPWGDGPGAVRTLEARLAGLRFMAVDVSDARVCFTLRGDLVPEILAKGAPVDLSDAAFPVGACRRTHLAEIAVGFWRRERTVWEIVCFRSFAHHLLDWLETVSREGAEVGFF